MCDQSSSRFNLLLPTSEEIHECRDCTTKPPHLRWPSSSYTIHSRPESFILALPPTSSVSSVLDPCCCPHSSLNLASWFLLLPRRECSFWIGHPGATESQLISQSLIQHRHLCSAISFSPNVSWSRPSPPLRSLDPMTQCKVLGVIHSFLHLHRQLTRSSTVLPTSSLLYENHRRER